jgi:adenylate cyclase
MTAGEGRWSRSFMIPRPLPGARTAMPIRTALVGYVCIAIVAMALVMTRALDPVDRAALDAEFAALRAWWPRPVAREVVIVGIDQESIDRLAEPFALWHPHFSKFMQAVAAGGAAATGLDVVLPERSYDAIVPGNDKTLLLGIITARRAAPLVLSRTIDPDGKVRPVHGLFLAAAGKENVAYALLPLDADGVVRRFDEHLDVTGEEIPTLAGRMARALGATPRTGLIDYSRGREFDYVPLHAVLSLFDAGDTAALKQAFAGKPVLLGGVLKYEDRLRAPVNLIAWEREAENVPGVVLHAQALRNLLDTGVIAPLPAWLVVALCLVAGVAWFAASNVRIAAALVIAGAAALVAGATALLALGYYLPATPGLATLVLAAASRTGRETALGMRERRKMRQAFSGYVSPGVMDDIMTGRINPQLGGDTRFVCALFSDIRSYTTRSESMTAEQMVAFLNHYFEQVVNIIHAHGGTVVSFMGDGIMVIFGAPKSVPNPSAAAFAAAHELLAYVEEFNGQEAKAGNAPIQIGVGLHAGNAVVGNVGASSRHNYTAIGDVINVASRLESLTKEVGYRLVYSKVVAAQLGAAAEATPLGFHQIKGHTPVEVYGYDKIG